MVIASMLLNGTCIITFYISVSNLETYRKLGMLVDGTNSAIPIKYKCRYIPVP